MTLPPPETPLDRTVRLALADGQCRAALTRAEAAIGRVRALHFQYAPPGEGPINSCAGCEAEPYPCATIRALDQPDDRPP